ncbi:TPA: DUF1778 domain-containing protein [Vibrio parahaemolyticus]|uniref:type II toxin-antitoxin system TacA family antitoxin n=3 Tax=Vibrio parahaemolyticus TaxID=670 RepID=UPI000676FE99|nr:DUF1778 domain-containing protein [Vibrio parahaemolyticus]EGQ8177409.1 DUF1778 domain-containing protein [Vibrio parahaemolyticus]EGQ9459696.1 DUF1778 domain-containing protein [Vibrio parahaemolyticus]EHK2848365.1 DUF1778 domain-containing protein [Vibrio parahaemolyticus]ELA8080032.1 DUF1778 domain-containing protein [Vibrio parahaemolyticus]ELA8099834.1 DUF1778 domain-containing protein [Vibrio parahaemolyticus]
MAENYTQRQVDRTARLDLKTNQHFKAQLEEAAALSGVNLTAFILSAAAEKVREVKELHSHTLLSSSSWNRLNDILESPRKEVTPAMRALFSQEKLEYGQSI